METMSSSDADLRVADADRERVATELREHFAAGRLTADELDEKLGLAYAARTAGELQTLRANLPSLPPPAGAERVQDAARRSAVTRQLLQQAGGALAFFLFCVLVWAFSDPHSDFWPKWALVVGALPLARNLWRLYGPAPEIDRVEADLAARRARGRLRP
jgi:hypothetical protein